MSIEIISIILFSLAMMLLGLGVPIAFAMGGLGAIFAVFFWGWDHLYILALAAYGSLQNLNLVAIPLFVLMGWILKSSGMADDMFEAMHAWLGRFRGGLAVGVILFSVVFGAMCGDLLAGIFTVTSLALAPMLKRGYDKRLAVGCIMAGGLLGLVIPPTLVVIIYAVMTGESVGRMYLGAFIPGLILASLYIVYVVARCSLNPELGPPLPPEARLGWIEKIKKLRGIIAPLALIFLIIGGIYSGAITPMEAATVGAVGAIIIGLLQRRLNWRTLVHAIGTAFSISSMIVWLFMGIATFSNVYSGIGALDLAGKIAYSIPGGAWGVVIVTQLIIMIFGMFLDDWAIIMIFGPIFSTVVKHLGVNTLWYGILFLINMQLAFLTPPYGFGLFAMRAAVQQEIDIEISMKDIYWAAFPFILLQFCCLIIIMIIPSSATWLPRLLIQ
jgi:tripartite ATP-independent transporter DctM subunit